MQKSGSKQMLIKCEAIMKRLLLVLLLFPFVLNAQDNDADKLLNKLKSRYNQVNDYEVDVKVNVNMSMVKVPETRAKIFFKKPGKIKLKSDSFAMLPKQGLNFSPLSLLEGKYTAIYAGQQNSLKIIKIIPMSDTSDIVMSRLAIDESTLTIRSIETTSKKGGMVKIDIEYGNQIKYCLPDKLKFIMDTPAIKRKQGNKSSSSQGCVTVTYFNYRINKGISDKVFAK
jgi:outer membrane lipoprotein-sorting protein